MKILIKKLFSFNSQGASSSRKRSLNTDFVEVVIKMNISSSNSEAKAFRDILNLFENTTIINNSMLTNQLGLSLITKPVISNQNTVTASSSNTTTSMGKNNKCIFLILSFVKKYILILIFQIFDFKSFEGIKSQN